MATKFKCPEPGCAEYVSYERVVVTGDYASTRTEVPGTITPRRVYLTCPNGHQHVYSVE